MADAKIVDIKGVQWELKDEVARNKITNLEQKTIVKITSKVNEEKVKVNLVEINNEKFLQIHFEFFHWSGSGGEVIAHFENDFNLNKPIRFIVNLDLTDFSRRMPMMIDILSNGDMRAHPIYEGSFTTKRNEGWILGDAFLRVTY